MQMRIVAVVLAFVGLFALAAAGTSDTAWRGGGEGRSVPPALLDYGYTIAVLLLLALAALVVWGLTARGGATPLPEHPRRFSLVLFLMLALALAGYVLITNTDFAAPTEQPDAADVEGVSPGAVEEPEGFGDAPPPQFQWWLALAAGAALLALLVAGRRRRRPDVRRTGAGEELEQVVAQALEELEFDADPRRAVIQAYARMERVLAAHGLPRKPHETPLEFLARVLRELHVRAEAAHALTELFERAKFSSHEIDAAMKAEAIASLEAVRDDLREAA